MKEKSLRLVEINKRILNAKQNIERCKKCRDMWIEELFVTERTYDDGADNIFIDYLCNQILLTIRLLEDWEDRLHQYEEEHDKIQRDINRFYTRYEEMDVVDISELIHKNGIIHVIKF